MTPEQADPEEAEEQNTDTDDENAGLTIETIVDVLVERYPEPATITEIGDELGYSRQNVWKRIHDLDDDPRVLSKEVGANAVVWWIDPEEVDADLPTPDEFRDAVGSSLSFDDVQRVMEEADEQLTMDEVADELGVSPDEITNMRHRRGQSDDDFVAVIAEAAPEPLTNKEVAERVGVDLDTMRNTNRLVEIAETGRIRTKKPSEKSRVYWMPAPDEDEN